MSEQNVDVVRRFETLMTSDQPEGDTSEGAFDGDNLAKVLALLDENVVFRPFAGMPGHGGDWVGHDGFLKMCEAYGSEWYAPEGITFEYLDAGEEKVVLLAAFGSRSRRTGNTVPIRMVEIITVRDGKITELVPYYHDGFRIVQTAGGPKVTNGD